MHILIKDKEMPVYEYICKECGNKLELFRHFYDSDDELACPICGKKALEKQFSTFSASGFSCAPSEYSGG
ncbi:MAG: zinc ribbon domain-containing protein [Dehalococcoidia bacterium]|nr:MAG: zinc ribbon domain-containing protein [Dehalococcoidia bacterium]